MNNEDKDFLSFWTEDLSQTPVKRKPKAALEARCHSKPCSKKSKSVYSIKSVSVRTVFCPDCSHALFWAKKGTKSGW